MLSSRSRGRTILVRIAADAEFQQRPDWKSAARRRVEAASRLWEREFRIRWKATEVVDWPVLGETLEQQRLSLRNLIPHRHGEILLGVRSFAGEPGNRSFGSVVPYSDVFVVTDYRGAPEQQNVLILAHEMAHLFGASHVPGGSALMNDQPAGSEWDVETRRSIAETFSFDFSRGLGGLDASQREHLLRLVAARLPAGTPNPRPKALCQAGVLLASDGEPDAAMTAFDESLRLDPADPFTHYERGRLLAREGKRDAAMTALRAALRLRPSLAEAHEELALLLIRQLDIEAAKEELLRAIELEPGRASAHFQLGLLLSREPQLFALSVAEMQESLRLQPGHVARRRVLELSRAARQALELAEGRASALAGAQPRNAAGHFFLGVALLGQGKCRESVAPLERALALEPRLGAAQVDLAVAQYCLGNYAEARLRVDAGRRLGVVPPESFLTALRARGGAP